jgi:hypothetical protein
VRWSATKGDDLADVVDPLGVNQRCAIKSSYDKEIQVKHRAARVEKGVHIVNRNVRSAGYLFTIVDAFAHTPVRFDGLARHVSRTDLIVGVGEPQKSAPRYNALLSIRQAVISDKAADRRIVDRCEHRGMIRRTHFKETTSSERVGR